MSLPKCTWSPLDGPVVSEPVFGAREPSLESQGSSFENTSPSACESEDSGSVSPYFDVESPEVPIQGSVFSGESRLSSSVRTQSRGLWVSPPGVRSGPPEEGHSDL